AYEAQRHPHRHAGADHARHEGAGDADDRQVDRCGAGAPRGRREARKDSRRGNGASRAVPALRLAACLSGDFPGGFSVHRNAACETLTAEQNLRATGSRRASEGTRMAIAMMSWLLAIPLLGFTTGLRSLTPMAVLCWYAYLEYLPVSGTWAEWTGRL